MPPLWPLLLLVVSLVLAPPALPDTPEASAAKGAPYHKLLIVGLAKKFDPRRNFEEDMVRRLRDAGVESVASTSMMDSRTPMTRQTYVAMVERVGADAVLVTQLADIRTDTSIKAANPEATLIVRPTYYYNVFSVEQTEYVEPPNIEFATDLRLATTLYDVGTQALVWSTETRTRFKEQPDQAGDYSFLDGQAKSIVKALRKSRLLARD